MTCVIIAAAGKGSRMKSDENKIFLPVGAKTMIEVTAEKFLSANYPVCIVCAENEKDRIYSLLGDKVTYAPGGKTRGESVYNGLIAMRTQADKVLVHDAARPFVSLECIKNVEENIKSGQGACAGVRAIDTVKVCDKDGFVTATPKRDTLYCAQTPQGFMLEELVSAYEKFGFDFSDDAGVFEQAGGKIKMTESEYKNKKITTREDMEKVYLCGIGYDVHQLCTGRDLVLGGVKIPHEKGLAGHSDADVLLHAVCDALLAAAGEGDIGRHFPDTDEKYKGISSLILLKETYAKVKKKGYSAVNVSVSVAAQRPKLKDYIPLMNKNIAEVLEIDESRVNVAATTTEKLGFEGEEKGISARAVVQVTG